MIFKYGNVKLGNVRGDSLLHCCVVVCLAPQSIVLRKAKAVYELGKKKSTVNNLLVYG